jgi:hypothetical protein
MGSMTASSRFNRQPLLAVKIEDRRAAAAVLVATLLCLLVGWAITSILAGRGGPFDYAIHNYSIGQLRIVLWAGTGFLTAGIVGLGWAFVSIGKSLARDARAAGFGLRISANGNGAYDRFVKWYGGVLVVAGVLLMPLGASLLVILATCRYMRDV